jgi:phosphoglycolate phosphatase-like HAD superfamily hydrolase
MASRHVSKGEPMRTVVFDLDGTLADTSADLLAAANACFVELGHTAPLGAADSLPAFHGGRAMLRLGFDRLGVAWGEDDISREYPRLLATYADVLDRETRLYPGAVQAVQDLRASGYATAICTNKRTRADNSTLSSIKPTSANKKLNPNTIQPFSHCPCQTQAAPTKIIEHTIPIPPPCGVG